MEWPMGGAVDPDAFCHSHQVNYTHAVDDPVHFYFCPVPDKGFDALAFMAIAILVSALQIGKMSALVVFTAGCTFQVLAFLVNLGPISNGLNLWLGISPAELFMYGFLPPLLFDSAVRVEMYVFKKMLAKVLTMAFLVVLACTAMMVPILLYVLRLESTGWTWVQAALFVAIVASTDAVTVNALVKAGGGPEEMTILLEGESLFNDASSLTLFSVFFALAEESHHHKAPPPALLPTLQRVVSQLVALAAGGALFGYLIGYLTRKLVGWLQSRGAQPVQELALVFAMAYVAYYGGQALLRCSGVVAVVVFGLYGAAKGRWELSTKTTKTGAFDGFLNTVTFGMNGLIFFYAGASSVNFVWRSLDVLANRGLVYHLVVLLGIYVAMFVTRYAAIATFNLFFTMFGIGIPRETVFFATVSGLRGALSLIMVQVVIQDTARANEEKKGAEVVSIVTAQLVLYTAGFVLLTLLINAPLMPWFMHITGLTKVSLGSQVARDKARRALLRFTRGAIADLKDGEAEILRGVDWRHVEEYTDLCNELLHYKLGFLSQTSVVPSSAPTKPPVGLGGQHQMLIDPLVSLDMEKGLAVQQAVEVTGGNKARMPLDQASTPQFDEDAPLLWEKGEDLPDAHKELLMALEEVDDTTLAGSACPSPFPTTVDEMSSRAALHSGATGNTVGVLLPAVKLRHSGTFQPPGFFAAPKESDDPPLLVTYPSALPRKPLTPTTTHNSLQYHGSGCNVRRPADPDDDGLNASEETAWRIELKTESRVRLISGFKRFAHNKREEGLLSAKGLRLLDYACDVAIDNADKPLAIWQGLEREMVGRWGVKLLAHTHVVVRNFKYYLMRFPVMKWLGVVYIFTAFTGYLGRQLSEKLLLACETAMGYCLALSYTPYVQWLAEFAGNHEKGLRAEVSSEAMRVWQFIVDREVEAPERFKAVQSYRAAMAVMHQQIGFVKELYMSGMINEAELEVMNMPIERRIGNLERAGATWQSPRTQDVLANLPFLENVPPYIVAEFVAQGELKYYHSGEVIFTPFHVTAQAGGLYCVLHGMVKGYSKHGDKVSEYFLGSGRVFGLMSALTGDGLPGSSGIVAAGNALGRGPVVFHVPAARLQALLARAASGDPHYIQLELDMYRCAGWYTLERLKSQLASACTRAYNHLLTASASATASAAAQEPEDNDDAVPKLTRRKSMKIKAEDIDDADDDTDAAAFEELTHERSPFDRSTANPGLAASAGSKLQATAKKLALNLVQSVREGISDAELVQLNAGQRITLRRHVVLLKGKMLSQRAELPAATDTTGTGGRQGSQHIQFQGPTVIPSLLYCPDAGSVVKVQLRPILLHALSDCLLLLCGSVKSAAAPEVTPGVSSTSFTDDMLAAAVPTVVEGGATLVRQYDQRPLKLPSTGMTLYAPEALQNTISLPP